MARKLLLVGLVAVLLGTGLVAASQAASLLQFQLLFGILIGVAAGAFYAPMIAVASAWIEQHRSLAVALVSAGMGMASLTVAPSFPVIEDLNGDQGKVDFKLAITLALSF